MPSGAVRLVAINANDARTYPEDSFQRMIERAAAQGYNFPSLRDESQETARAYGASHPPPGLRVRRDPATPVYGHDR